MPPPKVGLSRSLQLGPADDAVVRELYVDAALGDDDNEGTQASPLATLVEAERRIPLHVLEHHIIHVGPHVGDGYAPPFFRERLLHAPIDIIADSGGTQDDGFTELLTGTCQAGTLHTGIQTTGGLTVDAFRGKTVEMLDGSAAGFRRTIQRNDDVEIQPCLLWPGAGAGATPVDGDSFRILEPVVQIDMSVGYDTTPYWEISRGASPRGGYGFSFNGLFRPHPAISFVNFRLVNTDLEQGVSIGQPVRWFGVEIAPSATAFNFNLVGGHLAIGIEQIMGKSNSQTGGYDEEAPIGERLAAVDRRAWVGWGLNSDLRVQFANQLEAWIYGLVCRGLTSRDVLRAEIRGGFNVHTAGVWVPGKLAITGKVYLPDLTGQISCDPGENQDLGLWITPGGYCTLDTCSITAPAGSGTPAVRIAGHNSFFGHGNEVSLNGDIGVQVQKGAVYQFSSGGPNVTGVTGNEVEVGPTPAIGSYAVDFASAGDYLDSPEGSRAYRIS